MLDLLKSIKNACNKSIENQEKLSDKNYIATRTIYPPPPSKRVLNIQFILQKIDNMSEEMQKEQWAVIARFANHYSKYTSFEASNPEIERQFENKIDEERLKNMSDRIDKILSDDIEVDVEIHGPTQQEIAKSIRDLLNSHNEFCRNGKNKNSIIDAINNCGIKTD